MVSFSTLVKLPSLEGGRCALYSRLESLSTDKLVPRLLMGLCILSTVQ